ncbi:hypothetical protein BS50DRAFT_588076 [Corynespora cassiicola Philippines]|uniref:EthD domain-containing protein n=1 Tax=Corynespora cassiicola Philippines TaxID=1448308 RepID=A0A2T2NNR5_CORCC|nr:hypothetical protein BS50DRAFT_588076 [Corynespora cassiicola Philippines]
MADAGEKDCIQILTYIRRKRTLTPAQFYEHWEKTHSAKVIPWAEKHGIRRYQQIHVAGKMVPVDSANSAPNAVTKGKLPTEPIEFDGIAMFLVPSLKQFTDAFKDPYYVNIIEPDEQHILDKDGPGSGVVASFQGKMMDMVHQGQSTRQDDLEVYRKQLAEYE